MNEDRLIELMRELFEKMGSSSMDNFNKKLEESTKGMTAEEAQRKKNQLLQQQVNSEFDKFDKAVKRGRKSLLDLGPTIEQFEDSLEEMTDSIEKSETEQKRNALASQYLTAQYRKSAADISTGVSKALIGGLAKTTSSLVRSLQGNASGASLAGEILTNTIDTTQGVFNTMTKTGETLGTTLAMSTNPRVRMLGIVTAGASTAIEGITSSMSELAKFGINVMVKEVEKTIKAFNDTTAAGALFAGGMAGVRNAAADAGLTVEQFASVIKTNAGALADTGLTVTEAAKRMGQVGKIIKSSGIENNLMKLGFGFEEQAGLIAETMSTMRRSGVLGTATNAQVAEATERYAKNLRFIADLTGKDAEAAMKEAQAKNNQYAVDAKIRELAQKFQMDPAKVKQTIDTITASLAAAGQPLDGWAQQLATSTENFAGANAVAADHTSGMKGVYDNMITELNKGNFNVADVLKRGGNAIAGAADSIDYNRSRSVSQAALFNSGLTEFAQGATAVRSFANFVRDPKAIQDAIEARAKDESAATQELLKTEREAQKLRIDQEMILTNQLAKFGKVTADIIEGLEKMVKKAGFNKDGEATDITSYLPNVQQTIGGAMVVGGAAMSILSGGTLSGIGVPLAAYGAAEVAQGTMARYAEGGIVHRPELAMIGEGGNSEAVVPLPDNRSIPVTMTGNSLDTKEITSAIRQQSGVLNQILVAMKENNQLTSGILQTSY